MVLYLPVIDSINAQNNKELPKTWSTKLEEFMMGDLFKIQVRGLKTFSVNCSMILSLSMQKGFKILCNFFEWQDQAKLILRNGDQSAWAQNPSLSFRSWMKGFLTAERGKTEDHPFVNAFNAYVSKLSTEVLSCL